jgi:transcriptional regulator of acetoin/glycerol metabolism
MGRRAPTPGADFLDALARHDWPGNVRELLNLLERLLVERGGERLDAAALDGMLAPAVYPRVCQAIEPAAPAGADDRARVAAALVATGGNVARAARRLGLARSTLRHRIERYELRELIPKD